MCFSLISNRNQEPSGYFSSQEAFGPIPTLVTITSVHFHRISNDAFKAELVVTEVLSAEILH